MRYTKLNTQCTHATELKELNEKKNSKRDITIRNIIITTFFTFYFVIINLSLLRENFILLDACSVMCLHCAYNIDFVKNSTIVKTKKEVHFVKRQIVNISSAQFH